MVKVSLSFCLGVSQKNLTMQTFCLPINILFNSGSVEHIIYEIVTCQDDIEVHPSLTPPVDGRV